MKDLFLSLVESEENFIYLLCRALLFFMALSFIALSMGAVAPYGRYNDTKSFGINWGKGIPCQLAWFLQELPSFALPVICYLISNQKGINANVLLLSYFIVHYTNRTLIFPFRMRGGKDTPFGVFISALGFCLINGYINGRYLATFAKFDENYTRSP